ncbi:hypothetical protein Peur_045750 [Populus x canadensis]
MQERFQREFNYKNHACPMIGLRKQRQLSFALPLTHTLDSNFSIKLTRFSKDSITYRSYQISTS